MKGAISKTGYKSNSKDKGNDFNIIPSASITMKGVPHAVKGVDNFGNERLMLPGQDYNFENASYVLETPIKNSMKKGGTFNTTLSPVKARRLLQDGTVYGHPLSDSQRSYFAQIAGTDEDGNDLEPDNDADDIMKCGGMSKYQMGAQTTQEQNPLGRKVTAIPEGYIPHMNVNGVQTYIKKDNVAASTPSITPRRNIPFEGSMTTDPKGYEAQMQKLIDSGAYTPEQLILSGKISREGANKLKPGPQKNQDIVYMEGQKKQNSSSVQQSADQRIDRKDVTNLYGSVPYKMYQYPDNHAGYSKATTVAIDPKTGKQIDLAKSYSSGTYSPVPHDNPVKDVYLNTIKSDLPGTNPLATPATGNVTNEYFDNKAFDTKTQYSGKTQEVQKAQYGPVTPKKLGGSNELTKAALGKFITSYVKKQMGGSTAPQGDTTEDFISQRKNTFHNFLATNAMSHLMNEEVGNMLKAQAGVEVQQPFSWTPDWQNQNSVPTYVNQQNAANPQTPQGDQQSWMQGHGAQVATGLIAGTNLMAGLFEGQQRREQQKKLNMKTNADNLFGHTTTQNRGDYESNLGVFKPNQNTPVQNTGNNMTGAYKFGGSYKEGDTILLDVAGVDAFLRAGGELEYLD